MSFIVNSGPLAQPSQDLQTAYTNQDIGLAETALTELKAITKDELTTAYGSNATTAADFQHVGEDLASRIINGDKSGTGESNDATRLTSDAATLNA